METLPTDVPPEALALYALARAEVAAAVVLVLLLLAQTLSALCGAAGWTRPAALLLALAGVLTTQLPGLPSRSLGALTCAAAIVTLFRPRPAGRASEAPK